MDTHRQPIQKGIFLNLGLFQFLSFVRRGVFYTFMINYLYDLMQTVTFTALLGTLTMIGSTLGQNLLWGRISDRYKLRTKLVVVGETIAATAYFIVFLIHKSLLDAQANFTAGLSIILGLSLLEFLWSMSDVGWAALLTDVTTNKTRGKIVGSLNFIASLGRMVGIGFSGFLYNNGEGFRQGTIFYIVIAMLLASATVMWMTSKSRTSQAKAEKTVEINTEETPFAKRNEEIYKWFLISLTIVMIGAACINQIFLLFLKLEQGLNATDPEMSLILTAWAFSGMLTSLLSGWLADRIGRIKAFLTGLILAILTPLFYGSAINVLDMTMIYTLNGVAFWTIQTVGFAFAGDIIPQDKRGRLFSRYNTVMALGWGPAGLLVGGPLADVQIQKFGVPPYTAYVNTFYTSSIIVALGAILFTVKVVKLKEATLKS